MSLEHQYIRQTYHGAKNSTRSKGSESVISVKLVASKSRTSDSAAAKASQLKATAPASGEKRMVEVREKRGNERGASGALYKQFPD